MKPHLPVSLLRSLFSCLVVVAATTLGSRTIASAATYPNGSKTYTEQQTSALTLDGYETICFKEISSSSRGGAIYNSGREVTFTLCGNGEVSFSRNSTYGSGSFSGGAICNMSTFALSENGDVSFNGNSSSSSGGAIDNYNGDLTLNKNAKVVFAGNTASVFGGAICNNATFMMSENGDVIFSQNGGSPQGGAINNTGNNAAFTLCNNATLTFNGNTARSGAAIENSGTFVLRENGAVSFIGNTVTSSFSGGTIDNRGSFTLGGNGVVTFSGNKASSSGAAIYNRIGNFSLNDNDAVTFSDNLGGAIVNMGTFTMSENENVIFSGNSSSSHGSAIYNEGIFTLGGNGAVSFSANTASSSGGAIRNSGSDANFTLSGNGDVTFSENTASSGGAIYNNGSDANFTLSGNGDVTFSENTASSSGGAIYNYGTFMLSGNKDVSFCRNSGCSIYNSGSHTEFSLSENGNITFSGNSGGAIYNQGTFTLSENGDVAFSGNTASSSGGAIYNSGTFTLSDNGAVTFSENTASYYGGAIYNSGTFTLSDNGDVTFSGNSGGAIYNKGTFTLSEKGDVAFSGNTASSSPGGAIYNSGIFTLGGAGSVTFIGNRTTSSGGAIENSGSFTLSDNGDVTFSGNTAFSSSYASGGAIYNYGSNASFTLSGNGALTFSGNTTSSYGGAIYNSGTFTLSGNGDVTFNGNTASCSSYASGGAIYNGSNGTFTLCGNESVTIRGNMASSAEGSSYGGGIYNSGTFTLSGNGDVIFEKNAEVQNGDYRLRSIYSTGTLNLSATAGKSILFKDSVYASGTVNLNPAGAGDIIFTGASTEADLREMKGGVAGTAQEISDSRNSVLDTTVTLGGGTLQVRDGAVLSVKALTAEAGSTLVLHDGSLAIMGNALAGAVVVSGNSSIAAQASGVLTLRQKITNNGVLTLSGCIDADALAVTITDSLIATRVYCNTEGQISTDGFFAEQLVGCQLTLTQGTGTLVADDAVVRISDGLLSVDSCGIARGVKGIDFGTYYLHESSEKLSSILSISPDAIVQMSGGILTVDVNRATTILHDKASQLLFTTRQTGGRTFSAYDELVFRDIVSASSPYGGAMFNPSGAVTIASNRHVEYAGNAAKMGGAVFVDDGGSFILSQNEEVSFIGNVSTYETLPGSSSSFSRFFGGGAVASDGNVVLSGNGQLRFCDNTAARNGGAIYSDHGPFVIENNKSVVFSGNTAGLSGGAIYNLGTFELKGNGDVLFEKNAEIQDGSYRLRSIYSASGSYLRKPSLSFSASAGHHILFHDSVFVEGAFRLNPEGKGDIIFSGSTTEADLRELKGGVDGTAEEILNSRTSEIATMTYLYGGRLIVEDMAVMQGQGITVTENSGATVRVKDATLNHDGYALTFASGTTLASEGISTITASTVDLQSGSTLSFALMEENQETPVLSVNGTLRIASVSLAFEGLENLTSGRYILLSALDLQTDAWTSSHIRVDSPDVSYENLTWENGLLLLDYCAFHKLSWNLSKGVWNTDVVIGNRKYKDGDIVCFRSSADVTISGEIAPGEIVVENYGNVLFKVDKSISASGICGEGRISKSGAGVLTLNAGNSYSGGTVLNAGTIKATAADSFGTGEITVKGGTLDLASKAVANNIVLSGAATLKGDAKYIGSVRIEGEAVLFSKASYKGTTTIGEDSSLTLTSAAALAGNVALEGGSLIINNVKGMTLAKKQTLTLDGGEVRGLVTVGAGGTLAWQEGTMQNAPVLKGGTLELGGTKALTLTGSKAQVAFGDKVVNLPGKGIVRSDETLDVLSGTVKLTMGKEMTDAAIKVSGNAALVNGATHSGDITVSGTLAKGTTIKLIDSKQTVELTGKGAMAGAISGIGTVNVNLNANENIDATAAKLTAAVINLNSGTFTNTKGIKLAKGQTLTLAGASVNLGAKGILTTAAGSTLKVSESTTLSGNLTLGGGELVFEGAALTVEGTLTLSKPMTVTGSGTLICDSLKPYKGSLSTLFGGADVQQNGTTLTINGGATKQRLVAAPVAEEEAPLVAAPALPTVPAMPATTPVADAIAQADWGILDANRAFMGAVAARHQHAALLDKGQGAAWVSAFGSSVRHGNQGAHHGSDGNIEGAALGMEHSVSETGTVGLAVGSSKNRIGATGVSRLRQETAHVALYGQKLLRNGLIADATAAWGDTETKLGGSSWQQKSAALSGRLTHAHMVNDATAVRTFGGLSYEATESGSFGVGERSGSVQNLRAEVGAGASHSAGKAHFYGEASLTGDLIRHNPSEELGGIRYHGATPGRVGVKATLGAFYEITDTWTGTASYSVESESRTTSHTLNLGVGKSF